MSAQADSDAIVAQLRTVHCNKAASSSGGDNSHAMKPNRCVHDNMLHHSHSFKHCPMRHVCKVPAQPQPFACCLLVHVVAVGADVKVGPFNVRACCCLYDGVHWGALTLLLGPVVVREALAEVIRQLGPTVCGQACRHIDNK